MKFLFLLPFLLLLSCKDSTKSTKSSEVKTLITADELMRAQGASDFVVVIPDHITDSNMIGLAFKYPDGTVENLGSSTGWHAGEHVRVVIFSDVEGLPRYSIVSAKSSLRGTFPKKFNHQTWITSKPLYKTGESLIRYSTDANTTGGDQLTSDDVDLILYINPAKDNKMEMVTPSMPSD